MGNKTYYRILPRDTTITHYFWYGRKVLTRRAFAIMTLPDGRFMLYIFHAWEDGEPMVFGFEYADNIPRSGLNPLHIVRIYDKVVTERTVRRDIYKFLKNYGKQYAINKETIYRH